MSNDNGVTLNGEELHPSLLWRNRLTTPAAMQSNRTTLGQRPVIQHAPGYEAGRPIIIEAIRAGNAVKGFWTQAQILEIQEYERLGSQIPLHYHGQDFIVMVQAGSINVTPIIEYSDAQDSDKLSGAVTFIQL